MNIDYNSRGVKYYFKCLSLHNEEVLWQLFKRIIKIFIFKSWQKKDLPIQ